MKRSVNLYYLSLQPTLSQALAGRGYLAGIVGTRPPSNQGALVDEFNSQWQQLTNGTEPQDSVSHWVYVKYIRVVAENNNCAESWTT